MPPESSILDLTVRGVALSDETVHHVRRCNRMMVERAGVRDRRVQVLLERSRPSSEARAYVALANGASVLRGRGRHVDVLIAVRAAFDRLTLRLLETHPVARTPLEVVDESVALIRWAARRSSRP